MRHQDSAYDADTATDQSDRQQARQKEGFRGDLDEHWVTNVHNPAFWVLVGLNIYFVIAVAITLVGQVVAGMSQMDSAAQKFTSGWGFAAFTTIVIVSILVKVWSAAIRKPWDWHDALMPLAGLTIIATVVMLATSFGVGLVVIPFVIIPLFLMIGLPTLIGYWLGKLVSLPLTRRNAKEAAALELEPEPEYTPEIHREPVRFVPPADTTSPKPAPLQLQPRPQLPATPQQPKETPMPRLPTMPKLPSLPQPD